MGAWGAPTRTHQVCTRARETRFLDCDTTDELNEQKNAASGQQLRRTMSESSTFARAEELHAQKRYADAHAAYLAAAGGRVDTHPSRQRDLLDEICMHAAATGTLLGFSGRTLRVRPADPATAWLGLPAPTASSSSSSRLLPAPAGATAGLLEFGSLADVLDAAADGDVVQLLPGTHITSQVPLKLTKRLLIEGAGRQAADVVLDHRANHPVFTISRSCILRHLSIDMVGFVEAVAISSDSSVTKPFLQDVAVACSGDDGVTVGTMAQPLFKGCRIQARRCGLKQSGASTTTLWGVSISGCQTGMVVAGSSQAFLEDCTVADCAEDGIAVMQQGHVHLQRSSISGCKGPGLDLCHQASAHLQRSEVAGCCGGVWLWNSATCKALACHISGGSSFAVLLDEQAFAYGCSCTIDGPCHVSSSDDGARAPPHPAGSGDVCSSSTSDTSAAATHQLSPLRSSCRPVKVSRPVSQGVAARPSRHGTGGVLFREAAHIPAMSEEGWDASCSSLVDDAMCVEGVTAAALFPASTGAFAEEEQRLY